MGKKYQVIVADPPWKQSKGGLRSVRPNQNRELDYQTIPISEIEQHLFNAVLETEKDSLLFLWTIEKYLHEAEQMAKRLGYKLHARMIWSKKTGVAPAFTIRYGHEYLLYCYRGKLLPVAKAERGKINSVFTEQVGRHSAKPKISYEIIERLYPQAPKLEMYARQKRDGWDAWGNEVESDIDLEASLRKGNGA